jgi:hypothetical protein
MLPPTSSVKKELIHSRCNVTPFNGVIRARSKPTPARPYMARLSILNLLICPSVGSGKILVWVAPHRKDRPFQWDGGGHGVGGQARGRKRLGRGGDDRGWQAPASSRRADGGRGGTDAGGGEEPARRTRAPDPPDPDRGVHHLRSCPQGLYEASASACQRTRKIQTLFGTITVDAHCISACPGRNLWAFVDVSLSPLAKLLPDRCTPELRRLQAELSAGHSYREAHGYWKRSCLAGCRCATARTQRGHSRRNR